MKIEGDNPETGNHFETDAKKVDQSFINSMLDFKVSDLDIKKLIESLDVSADIKSLLYAFSKATIKAGQFILKIGRKIIDFVCLIFKEYPGVTFGVIFGAIAGFLIATIPIIGVILGPFIKPLAIAFGLVGGLREDIKDKNLARKIADINAKFSPLDA